MTPSVFIRAIVDFAPVLSKLIICLFIFKRRLHCNGGMRTDMIIDMDPVNHGGDSCFVAGKPFPANEHLAL